MKCFLILVRDSASILLQTVPKNVNVEKIISELEQVSVIQLLKIALKNVN